MPNSLDQILELVKRTGDNCVVLDSDGNPSYVVVNFGDYKKMVLGNSNVSEMTQEELLDKVNQDIAAWKASHEGQNVDDWDVLDQAAEDLKEEQIDKDSLNKAKKEQESAGNDENYYFEPVD